MATLEGGITGGLKGKIGKLVTRKVNGKTVVSERPDHYKETKSEQARQVRKRFSIAVEFSRYINSINILKAVWNYNRKKHTSVFNMVQSHNLKNVGDKAPSLKNIITPRSYNGRNECPYFLRSINFNGEEISASFEGMEKVISLYGEADYYMMFMILFYYPKEKERKYFVMDNIEYLINTFAPGKEIKIKLTASQKNKSAQYKKSIIYSATVVCKRETNRLYSSVSFANEFTLT